MARRAPGGPPTGGASIAEGDGDVDPVQAGVGGAERGPSQVAVIAQAGGGILSFGQQLVGSAAIVVPLRRVQRCGATGSHGADGPRQRTSALIYQHEARGADQAITGAIDSHVQAERDKNARGDDDGGQAGGLAPVG